MVRRIILSPADAAALFRAALPKEQKEELGVPLVDHIVMGSSSPAGGGEFASLAESGRLDGICEECKSAKIKSGGRR